MELRAKDAEGRVKSSGEASGGSSIGDYKADEKHGEGCGRSEGSGGKSGGKIPIIGAIQTISRARYRIRVHGMS